MSEMIRFLSGSTIIALRKAEFFYKFWYNYSLKIPQDSEKDVIKKIYLEVISQLDNDLFISDKEKETLVIEPNLQIKDLNLNKQKILDMMIKGTNNIMN